MLNNTMTAKNPNGLTMTWVKVRDAQGRDRMEMRWTAANATADRRHAA